MDESSKGLKGISSKRKLKAHTKSRNGCRNCKIRKIKCDEAKPHCGRCSSYSVRCNYGSQSLLEFDLPASMNRSSSVGILRFQRCSPITTILGMINGTIDSFDQSRNATFRGFRLNVEDLNRLERFQTRTVISLGTAITGHIYQQEIIKLVCQHPYLMHAVMTITCMHDRSLQSASNTFKSQTELYHYGQAASLFRQKLSQAVPTSDHDALWATCALLGSISFFSTDATTAKEAWPLTTSPTDLEWLELLSGIHAVWAIVEPTRSGSAFVRLSEDHSKDSLLASRNPDFHRSVDDLPKVFVDLCKVTSFSTTKDNPYLTALHNLAPLLSMTCNQNTFLCFLTFTSHMDVAYKQLLRVMDPRALLILAYWYAKLCDEAPWFLSSRASMECQAICLYLKRYHAYHNAIQELLCFPEMACGLPADERMTFTSTSIDS